MTEKVEIDGVEYESAEELARRADEICRETKRTHALEPGRTLQRSAGRIWMKWNGKAPKGSAVNPAPVQRSTPANLAMMRAKFDELAGRFWSRQKGGKS